MNDKALEKEYRELDSIKWELHDLLKKLVIKTNLGEIYDDYTDTVEFNIGNITIYSCGYYHQLDIDKNGEEINLDHDLETAKKIYREVEKRHEQFWKTNELKKTKAKADNIFEKPFELEIEGGSNETH